MANPAVDLAITRTGITDLFSSKATSTSLPKQLTMSVTNIIKIVFTIEQYHIEKSSSNILRIYLKASDKMLTKNLYFVNSLSTFNKSC